MIIFIQLLFLAGLSFGRDFTTNALVVHNAPAWVKVTKVEQVTERMQAKLEWTIRRIHLHWYNSTDKFAAAHSLGSQAIAVTVSKGDTITVHMSPKITAEDYESVLAHELVHVILAQKYKSAIPKWIEEGLANHLSKRKPVDYNWLASQSFPADVRELAHPFKGSVAGITYRYVASQALAEMLDKKCNLENLIRLSVERKMEDYIRTYCEIRDLNQAYKDWVKLKAR